MDKKKYIKFCDTEVDLPLFHQYYWLDLFAGVNKWDVVYIEKDNKIVASLPYVIKNKRISQPIFTQFLGPYIVYPMNQKYEKKLSYEKDIMNKLIELLPSFDKFNQNFSTKVTNWFPFYLKNFQQTTRYTYRINDLSSIDNIWYNLNNKTRTDIRKAQKKVKCVDNLTIEDFYKINIMKFDRQNRRQTFTLDFLKKVDVELSKRKRRKIFFAIDEKNNIHAVLYLVWDNNIAYYIWGDGDPQYRNSGAASLLMWEAIQFASTVTKSFDFEGSMIESIEKFFRNFGGVQTPYFQISKTNSKLLKIKNCIRNILNG
jgi:lipid II:glycine glycyltransferase (peptidoglycan interpeptide bridge formation enzyme)